MVFAFFSSIWKHSFIIPINKMEISHNSLTFFQLISLSPFQSCLNGSHHSIYFFFGVLPCSFRQVGCHSGWSTINQILYHSQSISDRFNTPKQGSWILHYLLFTSTKVLALSGIPLSSLGLYWLASLLDSFNGFNLSC